MGLADRIGQQIRKCGRALARYLNRPRARDAIDSREVEYPWWNVVQPGDVILVEGRSRIGTAIKYLTQSSWSHAALYVGDRGVDGQLIEVDVADGVIATPLDKYQGSNVRICRPIGLTAHELDEVLDFAISRLGHEYDLRNIFDLARYLIPTPPVPVRLRRRMISFGSGEPTKAICSTLIAQAFQSIGYPILPEAWWSSDNPEQREVCYQVKHFSTFTPRDFDLSPYFAVVKPSLEESFDFHRFAWHEDASRAPRGIEA